MSPSPAPGDPARTPARLRLFADNRPLRLLELASLLWNTAEQVYLVALVVVAYGAAGSVGVAVVGVMQSVPAVILLPLLVRASARVPSDRLLHAALAVRAGSILAATLVLAIGGPVALVIAVCAVDALAAGLARPTRAALVPQVARTAEELVTSNVSISSGRSLGTLIGPAIAALLLATRDPTATFALAASILGLALAVSLWVRGPAPLPAAAPHLEPRESVGTVLRHSSHARVVFGLVTIHNLTRGMLPVLLVSLAVEVFGAGGGAVGVMSSGIGLGGLIGGAVAITVTRRLRLAGSLGAGLGLWGIGLAVPGLLPALLPAVIGLTIAGAGKAIAEVASVTLLQRTIPYNHRHAAFGLLESVATASVAAGSVLGAVLVAVLGPEGGLVLAGVASLAAVGLGLPAVRKVDDLSPVTMAEIELLQGVPMLRPLALYTTEALAARSGRLTVGAGQVIVVQGEPGDTFYVVEAGHVDAEVDGTVVRRLGPGESFGEVALLRDTPRTATVRATEPCSVLTIDRETFLTAVLGRREAALVAQRVVTGYLGG